MSTHVNPLKAALSEMQGRPSAPRLVDTIATPKPAADAIDVQDVPPSRIGKKVISGHFEPLVAKQLKVMAAQDDRSIQSLLEEALNDLFKKYNKSPVA